MGDSGITTPTPTFRDRKYLTAVRIFRDTDFGSCPFLCGWYSILANNPSNNLAEALPLSYIWSNPSMAFLFFFALLAATTGFCQPAPQSAPDIKKPLIDHIGDYLHINARGAPPLLQAVDALQQKYGWAVNYEDPQYANNPADENHRLSPPHRLHAEATGNVGNDSGFSFQFNVGPDPNRPPDEEKLLNALVDVYNQSGGAAQFKVLRQQNGNFTMVGVAVRVAAGQFTEQQPILDLPITIARERRTAAETVALVCRKIAQQGKTPISLSSVGGSFLRDANVVVGGSGVPAREMLQRVLAATGGKTYWQLIYDFGTGGYRLNLYVAPSN